MTALAEHLLPQMDTLRGDLRDLMLGAMSQMTRLWKDTPEHEQMQTAQVIDAHAQGIVARIAILTATAGQPTVLVTLDKLDIAEKAKGVFTVSKDQAAHLVPYTDQIVAIKAVGLNQFMGERRPVQTMPDQPALPMGDAEPEDPDEPAPQIEPEQQQPSPAVLAVVTPTPRKRGPKPKAKTETKPNGAANSYGSPFQS